MPEKNDSMIKKRVAAITFGCKINQYETSCILHDFEMSDYQVVDFSEQADVYVINSCTVTNRTDYKSRNAIRQALQKKKINAAVKIVVTGCYSQLNYDKVKEMGVDFIADNNQKNSILNILDTDNEQFTPAAVMVDFSEHCTDVMYERSRAFIKIQDGCDYFCHYCAIPYARGKPRSRQRRMVIKQVHKLCANGYREIVLSGINLGLYKADDGSDIVDLLAEIEAIDAVELIRLSSIEPPLFTKKLLDFYQTSRKLCPHFHIPLQTGNDELLAKMNRNYTTADYEQLISNLLAIRPDTAIGLDVITGLPTETDAHFRKTYQFIETLPIAYLHVFSYSKRPGTVAAKMSGQNSKKTMQARSKKLIELSKEKTSRYRHLLLKNKILLKGIAEKNQTETYTALSDHFLRVYFTGRSGLEKRCLRYEIIAPLRDGLEGKIFD